MRAVVEIKGGFGNQIFQYAFSNYLKECGYKVSVNLQESVKQNAVVSCSQFGFTESSKILVIFLRLLFRVEVSKNGKNIFSSLVKKYFSKHSNLVNFNENSKKYLYHFDGYWQDLEIFTKQKDFIISCLSKSEILLNRINKPVTQGSTLLHVRRGDYKNVNEELNIKYYEEAINICSQKIENFTFEVFTDDISWVSKQKIFEGANAIHGPTNDLIVDISNMLNFENYIISNSSFSLVLASISEKKTSTIITPTPWMKHSRKELNLKNNWIKIKNY